MINNKKVIAVIQARMESTRLPGKVLMLLADYPALGWMAKRIKFSKYVDEVILAIPDTKESRKIEDMCFYYWKAYCSHCERGDMEDVCKRVIKVINSYSPFDILVDLTGDCPLIDPRHIDTLLKLYDTGRFDYVSNIDPRSWPDGCDIQIYNPQILKDIYPNIDPQYRQHTGWNILQRKQNYKTANFPAPFDLHWPSLRLTLDTYEDYQLLDHIFKVFKDYGTNFKIEDVIRYMKVNPSLIEMNKHIQTKVPGE